jgi:hypothetical protein
VRNSPRLPAAALVVSVVLAMQVATTIDAEHPLPLSELQLGGIAVALAMAIFGVQGLVSVAIEGQELRPGIVPPQLTNPLSAAIVVVSFLLFVVAILLGYGIVNGWDTLRLGVAAGAGCLFLGMLLIFYKEAFLGDEARFDDREDGIPW